jgi:hypothetical protein
VRRRTLVLSVLAVVLLAGVVVHRIALRDLRRLEQDYISAREPTACANQALMPLALGRLDVDDLDEMLVILTNEAHAESVGLRDDFKKHRVFPFPPVEGARAALADALDQQVALYDAMIKTPDASDDELRRLGRANSRFERRAESARSVLFVGEGEGWNRRFVCDDEPPVVPPP